MDTKTEVVRSTKRSGEREKKAEWVNETPGSDNRSLPAADTPALGEWAGCGWAKAELVGLSIIRSSRTH